MRNILLLLFLPLALLAQDDEPDSLSWERYSQDRGILLHYLGWAATNPPPGSAGILPAAVAQERDPSAARFPFVWVKAAQTPFTGARVWTNGTWRGEACLYCERYRTGRVYQTVEVPEDGVYRFWIRQAHTKGTSESNFFRMTPAFDGEKQESDENSALFTVFQQMFARANLFRGTIGYSRPRDPAPEINGQPTPPSGFLWEATAKTAFLRKGRYTVSFSSGVVTTPRSPLCITDYVLVGDPFFSPEELSMPSSTNGHWRTPPETLSPLYAIRPGAGLAEGRTPDPALAAWWKKWREALFDRLIHEEHGSDYYWGNLASCVAFDEESNAIDRPSRLRALRELNAQSPDSYSAFADEFEHDATWVADNGDYHKEVTARALKSEGKKFGSASYTFDVARPGTYHLWTLIYQSHILRGACRGAMQIDIEAPGGNGSGRKIASYIIGAGDGSVLPADSESKGKTADAPEEDLDAFDLVDSLAGGDLASREAEKKRPSPLQANEGNIFRKDLWNDSGAIELPAGRIKVTVKSVFPPWGGEGGAIQRRIFCRAILTARRDFIPDIPHEFPQGDRVGDGQLGFWRSPDPWTGVSRHSPPATGRYLGTVGTNSCRVYEWKPIPKEEVNAPRHTLRAVRGEKLSELLVVRNNTADTVWIEPETDSDLPARCRLVAWGPTPDGGHTPRFLLARRRIAIPPYQNVPLWMDIDCSAASPGLHRATLAFGGLSHTWDIKVEGSIEDVAPPLAYPWSAPFARKSCWELYRELGFNVITVYGDDMRFLTKRAAEHFGMRLFRLNADTNTIATTIADWRRRGFSHDDICFDISDEPGFGAMTNWVAIAKAVKAVDHEARIWCNTGFFPNDAQWEDCQEFMSLWDVFCPFRNAFIEGYRPPFNQAHLSFYRKIGNPKLGYITPSTSIYWLLDGGHEVLEFAEQCRKVGRDGWSSVRFQTATSWELAHPELQPIFTGAWGRTISTRYAETAREANQRWRKAKAGIDTAPSSKAKGTDDLSGTDAADGTVANP